MAETKINANQTNITASDIGAASTAQLAGKQDIMQYETLPTASADNVDSIVQFVGATDSTYTNGYFYKCTESSGSYSWVQTDVQPSPVIPDPLPSQTGQSGKYLTTNGSSASWGTINALQNTATNPSTNLVVDGTSTTRSPTGDYNIVFGKEFQFSEGIIFGSYIEHMGSTGIGYSNVILGTFKTLYNDSHECVVIGVNGTVYGYGTIAIGGYAGTRDGIQSNYSIAIGDHAYCTASYGCIQIGSGINTENQTLKIGFSGRWGGGAEYQYKLLDSDGTIPTDRFTTTPTTDGTYIPSVTVSNGVATRAWQGADYVIDFQAPTAENNYTWYRKYKSGWVEQGGWQQGTAQDFVVTLPVTMADNHYTVSGMPDNNTGVAGGFIMLNQNSQTTTGFMVVVNFNGTQPSTKTMRWQVSGMAAQ